MMGAERRSVVMPEEERRNTAYHESGHAVVARLLDKTDPVHKVTIIPRGRALGVTMQLPTEDRYLMTRQELLGKIDILLGGRMAEELVFGDVSTGAHNDLQRATDIARAMVSEYGMGQTLGLSTYPRQTRPMFLSPQQLPMAGKEYSEATAARLDEEVKELITERAAAVKQLLSDNQQLLEALAQELLRSEVVEGEAFYQLVDGHKTSQDSSPA